MNAPKLTVSDGQPYPLGARPTRDGVAFSIVSRHATRVWLELYRGSEDANPYAEFELKPERHRTGDVWHIEICGLSAGDLYLYQIDGPFDPAEGHRFNRFRPLIDPYARALTADFRWDIASALAYDPASDKEDLSFRAHGNAAGIPKCIVIDNEFDWQGDRPLNLPLRETVIYEMHVRGLSVHPSAGVEHPGTYRGVIEMIPYLKELGITSVELLPVHEFDEWELGRSNPIAGVQLLNYWGYSTLAFFAPKGSYAADGGMGQQVVEFKEMVRELHKAGIEVILDVVFNHTGEGNHLGPTISFRGIDNSIYYMLEDDARYYKDFSGCGNTLNCNVPIVRTMITESLHYWVVDMHVDGFRFDLGSILGRGPDGALLQNPPLLERIAQDPILQNTKIIAEAWDAGGAYQVGGFPGGRWAEWNDKFRDEVRTYWRGDKQMVAALATRFAGSSDLYLHGGRKPFHSINFVTAHDGFTLNDLVSYRNKHNQANGENNQDGHDANYSHNYGVEGPSTDPAIQQVRLQQMKNMYATLLLSLGTPMMLAGDELGRTQMGNNNAYCQDNETSWTDYSLKEKNAGLFRFVRRMIEIRKSHPVFRRPDFYTGRDNNENLRSDIEWFGVEGGGVNWDSTDPALAAYIDGSEADPDGSEALSGGPRVDDDFLILFNAAKHEVVFHIVTAPEGKEWRCIVDSALPSPRDVCEPDTSFTLTDQKKVTVAARSIQVLRSRPIA